MSRRKQSRPFRVPDEDIKLSGEDHDAPESEKDVNSETSMMIDHNDVDKPYLLNSPTCSTNMDESTKEEKQNDPREGETEMDDIKSSNTMQIKEEKVEPTDEEQADKNNNDPLEDRENKRDDPKDEKEKLSPALDLSKIPSFPPLNHVTLETLQNTKVAVAQFAAAALANSQSSDEALKELAVLQSTLFNIQHQQLFQIQLIQQLQSQLSINRLEEAKSKLRDAEKAMEDVREDVSKECKEEKLEQPLDLQSKKVEESNERVLKTEEKTEEPKKTVEYSAAEAAKVSETPTQPPLCQISSSLASSIITNHDPPPSLDEPNSLEMLQRTAQEVLDSASQGILAGNMADELAFRKDRMSQDGGRGEPFFKHRCRYCGKVFGSDSALQIHIRSHTGERPFRCNVCGSRFTTKGNLKVHYQRHTQRYPTIPMHGAPMLEPPQGGVLSMPPNHGPIPPPPPSSMAHGIGGIGPPLGLPFPPGPPNFPPLPHFRPPIDMLKPILPFSRNFFPEENASHTNKVQDEPADLSKPPRNCDTPKREEEVKQTLNECDNDELEERRRGSIEDYSVDSQDSDQEQPENLSKVSVRSSVSRNSNLSEKGASSVSDFVPPTEANENTPWETLIEITKTSETSKLQQLVDNIENKLTDPNQCVFCQKVLSCRSALQMHYRTHTGERPFRCKICGRAFATKGNLKAHMSIHKIRTPIRGHFKCPVCHKKYQNGNLLQEHIQSHSGEKLEGSSEMARNREENFSPGKFFGMSGNSNDMSRLESYMASESSQGDFEGLSSYEEEERSAFGENEDDDDSSDIFMEMLRRSSGERDFNERSYIDEEIKNEKEAAQREENRKTMPMFDFSPDEALDLTPRASAERSYKRMSPSVTDRPEELPLMASSRLHGLDSHLIPDSLKALLPNSPFNALLLGSSRTNATCSICLKTFACNSALEIHLRSHTKERPFKCSICEKTFTTKKEEITHSALHYISDKGNLKQHMLVHSKAQEQLINSNSNLSSEDRSTPNKCLKIESPTFSHSPSSTSQHSEMYDNERQSTSSVSPALQNEPKPMMKRTIPDIEQPLPKRQMLNSSGMPSTPVSENSSFSNFNQRSMLSDLLPSNEPPNNSISDPAVNTKHYCTICRRNFSSSSALQIHMRTHTGDKPFRCNMCQKAFTTKGNLKVHMGTHMWTNGASRRGRRMSLELPLGRPLPIPSQDQEFLQRRPDIFYPYLPQFLNGMQQKFNEMNQIQPPPMPSTPYPNMPNGPLPPGLSNKFAGLIGFGPFPPSHNINIPNLQQFRQMSPSSSSSLSDRQRSHASPEQPDPRFHDIFSDERKKNNQNSVNMSRFWGMQCEQQRFIGVGDRRLSRTADSPVAPLNREGLVT